MTNSLKAHRTYHPCLYKYPMIAYSQLYSDLKVKTRFDGGLGGRIMEGATY